MSEFEFLRPAFLWLFGVVLLMFLLEKKQGGQNSSWEKVCDAPLLQYLLEKKESAGSNMRSFWKYLGLIFAVIALAGPSFQKHLEPAQKQQMPLMIVLDLSSDMNRTDIRPSRLARAKIEISDIFEKTKAAPSGLIVYTYEPFLISPLSQDYKIIENLLPSIQSNIMPIGGNRLDRALELAVQRLKDGGFHQGQILVLTHDTSLGFDEALKQAQNALTDGFKTSIFALSLGKNEKLEKIAKAGGGEYADMQTSEKLVSFLKAQTPDNKQKTDEMISVAQDNGYWFVFALVFCLLYFFRKGALVLAFVLLSFHAEAGFLFNNNQEGAIYFKAREFDKAAKKFENEDWKGAALYKAKNYPAAIEIYKKKNDVTSLYNLGNALAKGGKIPQAIEAYEKVLKENPNHEDAKFNLEYLKKMMQNQDQSQNSENKKQENPQNQNKTQDNQQASENENNEDKTATDEETGAQNDKENEQQEQEQQQSSFDESEDKADEQSSAKDDNENELKNDMSQEKQEIPQMPAKEQEAEEYNETVQAREQKFREIKDDPGGLLKAFIKQEYMKNRYGN
ncbi:MAG: VWA domain-containing protein [Alphaproteobacteria bacterium]|nr:VWA domain-containing protein [Alphaproteobacteria bacterium]